MPARRPERGLWLLVLLAGSAWAQSPDEYFRRIDRDFDGALSRLEFQDWMSRAFHSMDRNGDRVLDPDEQLIANAPRVTLADLHQRLSVQFDKQDRNADGRLSPAEYLAPPQ